MVNISDKTNCFNSDAACRKELYQWAIKWFYGNLKQNTSKKPDISSIISLLQIIGFKLEHFGKQKDFVYQNQLKKEEICLKIECGTSKMAATLRMEQVPCSCLDTQEVKDGSFWSITGTVPKGNEERMILETGSDLLPVVSQEKKKALREVVYKIFDVIVGHNVNMNKNKNNENTVLNKNFTKIKEDKINDGRSSPLFQSFTDINNPNYIPLSVTDLRPHLESFKLSESNSVDRSVSKTSKVINQDAFDMNHISRGESQSPRKAPSPSLMDLNIPDMDTSLDDVSMNIDQSIDFGIDENLTSAVLKAHKILDEVVKKISLSELKKRPISSSLLSLIDYNEKTNEPATPLMSSSFCSQTRERQANSLFAQLPVASGRMNRSLTNNNNLSNKSDKSGAPTNKLYSMNRSSSSFIPTRASRIVTQPGSASCSSKPSKLHQPNHIGSFTVNNSKLSPTRETLNSPAKITVLKTKTCINSGGSKQKNLIKTIPARRSSLASVVTKSIGSRTDVIKQNVKLQL